MSSAESHDAARLRAGVGYALGAYITWGFAPLYFLLVEFAQPLEIISHRAIWSLVIILVILGFRRRLRSVIMMSRRTVAGLLLSGSLLCVNWFAFVWALQNERVMETTVGYYLNPLISIVLGVLLLGERQRPLQWVAVVLAGLGVANEIFNVGSVPVVALTLAFSFGFYGLVRKRLGVDALPGLAVETALVLPLALALLAWLAVTGTSASLERGGLGVFYLALGGVVTLVPLVCFNAAAIRLPLVTLGMFQYLAPSITLALAVFHYGEPFTQGKAYTFALIWSALAIYTLEAWLDGRRGVRQRDREAAARA
ncbi:MAG: EamA family transporter RarD [Pseudomonadota bacterium]